VPEQRVTASVERILSMLDFNLERIVVLDLDPWTVSLNCLGVTSDERQVECDFDLKHVYGIISKNFIPTLIILQDRFWSILDEKRNLVANSVNANMLQPVDSVDKLVRTSRSATTVGMLRARLSVYQVAVISIRVSDIQLALFKEQFDPSEDCVQIIANVVECKLSVVNDAELVKRQLRVKFTDHTVIKKCLKREQLNVDTKSWSITQWNDHISARQFKKILDLPPTQITMDTKQPSGQRLIQYIFKTHFDGAIDINLNIAFLKFFQDIANEFGDQMSQTVKELRDFIKAKKSEGDYVKHDTDSASTVSTGSQSALTVKSAAVKPSSSTVDVASKLKFQATQPIVLEPQLKVIEGVTPNDLFKWIGIQKDSIPVQVHTHLTLSLEHLMTSLVEFLPEQSQ
jgi:hypothetical protein